MAQQLFMSVDKTDKQTVYTLRRDNREEVLIVTNRGEIEYSLTEVKNGAKLTRKSTLADCIPYMKREMMSCAMKVML